MRLKQAVAAVLVPLMLCACTVSGKEHMALDRRWFFVHQFLHTDDDLKNIKTLVDTASAHGLNGMVLSVGLESIKIWSVDEIDLLIELNSYCKTKKIEIIPCIFSVGTGNEALRHDRNFAAALPATIPLAAEEGWAAPAPSVFNYIKNGDLEKHQGNRFADYTLQDQPGKISFVDTEIFATGTASIRFQDFYQSSHGHGRIMQEVTLYQGRSYRLSMKVKTRDLEPASSFKILVLGKDHDDAQIANAVSTLQATSDWTDVTLEFVPSRDTDARIYAGVWESRSGTLWIDDLILEEPGSLADIVRRDGTPLSLKSADGVTEYRENRDFDEVKNESNLKYITFIPPSRIKKGDRLLLSCYKTPFVSHSWGRQISLCMSNPRLYEYWESAARDLHSLIAFRKVLLNMDEIPNGGGCLLCRGRSMTMAEILGDSITRQYTILKKIDPGIEVLVWSDMLDPNHNAHDFYYNVAGDFTGSWEYVPKDIILACWYYRKRDKSLSFFSDLGFRTLGAAYYDGDDLDNPRGWLKSLRDTPNAAGIMYTTWRKKYLLLGQFGDLVSE